MAERLKIPANKHLNDIVKKNKLPVFKTAHTPRAKRQFQDYAHQIVIPYLLLQLESVDGDIVWDIYLRDSLKQSTRECRINSSTSQQQHVLENAPVPANWESLLNIELNKDEMFRYLAECIL